MNTLRLIFACLISFLLLGGLITVIRVSAEPVRVETLFIVDSLEDELNEDDDLVGSVAAFIRQDPEIAEVFQRAMNRLESGKMSPSVLRELVRYASFLMEDRG